MDDQRFVRVSSVIYWVLDAISQAARGEERYEFATRESVDIDPPFPEQSLVLIDEVLSELPHQFRDKGLNALEVEEVCRELRYLFGFENCEEGRKMRDDFDEQIACKHLSAIESNYFDELVRDEIKGLDLADAFIHSKKKATAPPDNLVADGYIEAFKRLSDSLEREIEFEKERLSIKEQIRTDALYAETPIADQVQQTGGSCSKCGKGRSTRTGIWKERSC